MQLNKKKFAVILGTRPNFVKAAPFFIEAKKRQKINFTIIHTGQHFDENMSKIFFDEMGIPKPDINLDIQGEFHTEKIGKMFNALTRILDENRYDYVIVFGDVNSTLAGAIAAARNHVKLIHIEAGLRSHDRRMPEEINRCIVDHLSDILFTTEPSANDNLLREDISQDKIHYVGNIMIESLELFWPKIEQSKILDELKLAEKKYAVATIHRQENTDDRKILEIILKILNKINENLPVVIPLHPGTRNKINFYELSKLIDDLNIIEPLGYFDFIRIVSRSRGVITDSGGIQEETTHLGIPCCTLRDNTERPITLELGSNKLFPIDLISTEEILSHIMRQEFNSKPIPLWDNKVSERIFEVLKSYCI